MHTRLLLCCIIASLLFVTACQIELSGPTETATPGSDPAPVTLRVGTGDSGDGLIPYNRIITAFEAENPDITVVVEPVESHDYYTGLLAQIEAGSPPDLMLIGEDALPRFADLGALEDLRPYLTDTTYPLDPTIYLPGIYRPGRWQDQQYLLPKDYSTVAVFYNKALFDTADIPYPDGTWSWEEFRAIAQQLTDQSKKQYGVQLPTNWPRGFEYWVVSAGGQMISENGTQIQGYLDSEATIAALQFYADLYHTDQVAAPPGDLDAFTGVDYFATGQAAMRLFGRWPQTTYVNSPELKDVVGVAPPPIGVQRATVIAWSGFGISASSMHKQEAWRFLRYLTGPQGATEWANWGLPAVTSVAESRNLFDDPLDGQWLDTLTMIQPIAAFASPYWGEVGEPKVREVLNTVITDPDADIAAVLTVAATEAQTALNAKHESQ